MGNSTSTNKNSNLATEIDRIASKYILSQNFSDMNKMSEKDHCDKVMILTAKIINQNINPLEQKEIVKRIENGNASKEESKDKKEEGKKEEGKKEEGKKKEGEEGEEGEEEVTTKKTNKEDDKKIKKKKGEEGEEEEGEGEEGEEEEEEAEEGEKAAKKKKKKGGAEPLQGEPPQAAPPAAEPPVVGPPQAEPPQEAPPAVGPPQAVPPAAEPPAVGPTQAQAEPIKAEPTQAEPTKAEPPIAPTQAPTQTEPTKAAPSTPTPSKSEPTSEGVEGGEPPCVTIAKFYVKIAHLYAAIMKTVNPVIISTDKNGKIQKYDLMSKQTIPTDIEIQSIEHNNFCTKRLNNLIQDSDYNERDPKNILMTLKPRFCNINYNKATKSTRKFYEEERKKTGASEAGSSEAGASEAGASESNEEANEVAGEANEVAAEAANEEAKSINKDKGSDKDEVPLNESNSELGIPELMKLYYDVFDETTNDYTSMSDSMRDIYEHDVETFYTTFTGKPMPVDENGQALITRFDQIPLRDYHKNDKCKPGNMFTQNYEGSLNDKLFKDYAMHINKMMSTMNTNQNKLYKILQQLFKFQEPKKKEKKKEEPKEKPKEEVKEGEESKAPTTQGQIVIANMQQAGPTDAAAPGPTDAAAPLPTDVAAPLPPPGPLPTDAPGPLPVPAPLPTDAPLPEAPVPTQEAAPAAVPVPAPAPVPASVEETPVDSTKSGDIKVGGSDDDNVPDNVPDNVAEEESVIIHPNLDDKLLQSLINTTRKLIVELYVTCETHFLEGIVLFESIVAVQLAKTTGSQIKLLNDATINYLEHHTNNNL